MKYISYFIIVLIICSCSDQPGNANTNSVKRLSWLIGSWKNVSENTTMYENWMVVNDSIFSGNSFAVNGTDTVFSEKIVLQQVNGNLYYIPTVSDQNGARPVEFKFVECKDGEFIFENKEHDFPQRIIYKNPQPEFLCARIEGIKEGKDLKEDFNFVKVK